MPLSLLYSRARNSDREHTRRTAALHIGVVSPVYASIDEGWGTFQQRCACRLLRRSVDLPRRTRSRSNGLHGGRALVGLPRLQQTRFMKYGFDLFSCLLRSR